MRWGNHRIVFLVTVSLSLLINVGMTCGALIDSTWNGGVGSWEVPSNWTHVGSGSPDFPDNDALTYDATISSGTAQLDAVDVTINQLMIDGGALSKTGSGGDFIHLTELLDFSSGTIDNVSVIIDTHPGTMVSTWSGGTLQNGTVLENNELLYLGGTDLFITGTGGGGSTRLDNLAELQWDSAVDRTIHLSNGGQFVNGDPASQMNITGSGNSRIANDGSLGPFTQGFVNVGTLSKRDAGTLEFDVLYDSTSSSTLDLVGGAVMFNFGGGAGISAVEQEGVINIGNTTEYIVNGAQFRYEENSTINNSGTFEVRAGSVQFFLPFGANHSIYNGDGTDRLVVSGGTLRPLVPITTFELEVSDGEIEGSVIDATLFNWSGGNLQSGEITVDGPIAMTGPLTMSFQTINNNSIGSWSPQAHLDAWSFDRSTFINNGPFTVDVAPISDIAFIEDTFDSYFENRDRFVKNGLGTLEIGVAFINEELGTIEVDAGTLALGDEDNSIHGDVTIASNANLEMTGGTIHSDGRIEGDGGLKIGGITLNGLIGESLLVTITGDLDVNREQNVGFWVLGSGSEISGAGDLSVPSSGNLLWTGGTISGTGQLIVDGDLSLSEEGGFPGMQDLNRAVTVNGEVDIRDCTVSFGSGADMTVNGVLKLVGNDDVTIIGTGPAITNEGETFITTSLATTTFDIDFVNRGEMRITNGTFNPATGSVTFQKNFRQEAGRLLYSAGTLNIGFVDLQGGILQSSADALVGVTAQTINAPTFGGPTSTITLEDTTISVPGFPPILVPGADLTIGDASRFDGFRTEGTIKTANRSLTLHSAGFANLGVLTQIDGGTVIAANGVALGVGNNISGFGAIQSRVAASLGSTIVANGGNLTIGDAAALDGFHHEGTLHTNENSITLNDANEATLGALTTLGTIVSDGTLAAPNGLVLDFGENITGRGLIDTVDDSTKPVINNGNIVGNSMLEMITLDGYVKGVGTCDFCNITGTDAPGLSTASVTRGSVSYNGTLEIEIGDTIPGSGFDQLNHILGAGVADLGGTLDVSFLGSFTPSAGATFEIITAASVLDTFDTVSLPALPGDLLWFVNYGANSVELVSTYAADFDEDGDVDDNDLIAWEGGFGNSPAVHMTGDANTDTVASGFDFLAWQRQFGSGGGAPFAATTATPEPSSLLLASLAGCALLHRRRRI